MRKTPWKKLEDCQPEQLRNSQAFFKKKDFKQNASKTDSSILSMPYLCFIIKWTLA